jgi:GNAT superfamily N-acetyltransferase
VGTCALLKSSEGEYELTKMGVLPSARGLKVGERLLEFVIDQAKALNCERLYLLTNKRCEAAIHLYEKLGFEHSSMIMENYGYHYERCDVAMLLAQ